MIEDVQEIDPINILINIDGKGIE